MFWTKKTKKTVTEYITGQGVQEKEEQKASRPVLTVTTTQAATIDTEKYEVRPSYYPADWITIRCKGGGSMRNSYMDIPASDIDELISLLQEVKGLKIGSTTKIYKEL